MSTNNQKLEFLEIYNSKGLGTGLKESKYYIHKNGLHHITVHLWVFTGKRNVLIQKRSKNKELNPGVWDVSVAGHVHFKENIKNALSKMSKINQEILDKKLFPMTFGGEHSITPGCIVPFTKKYKDICLLHFDAHADLRESYNGEKFSHASAIKRCLDYPNVSLISFGIRNISKSEIPFLKKNSSRIKIFWAKDKIKWDLSKFKKLIKNKKVYLTFDVDGLDSSIMPATGTPEPGGLLWDETLNIIKIAAKNSQIVGADINELSPIKGFNSYNFLVAKLAYKILSYKFLY